MDEITVASRRVLRTHESRNSWVRHPILSYAKPILAAKHEHPFVRPRHRDDGDGCVAGLHLSVRYTRQGHFITTRPDYATRDHRHLPIYEESNVRQCCSHLDRRVFHHGNSRDDDLHINRLHCLSHVRRLARRTETNEGVWGGIPLLLEARATVVITPSIIQFAIHPLGLPTQTEWHDSLQ